MGQKTSRPTILKQSLSGNVLSAHKVLGGSRREQSVLFEVGGDLGKLLSR